MVTADSVKAKIQDLIDTSNKTTGQNDTTLTDAVNHLKDGYGQGGDGGSFMNIYQDGGKRTDYSTAFAGVGWNNENFKPEHDLIPKNAYMMFRGCGIEGDLIELLGGRPLDFSNATNTQYIFANAAKITRVGVIDVRCSTNSKPLECIFQNCSQLVTIDKIYPKSGSSGAFGASFNSCINLENLTIEENSVDSNGLDLHWSTKLSKASIESVINALSTTTSGLNVKFSKAAVGKAFETASGANDGSTSQEWISLRGTRSNWTISLS